MEHIRLYNSPPPADFNSVSPSFLSSTPKPIKPNLSEQGLQPRRLFEEEKSLTSMETNSTFQTPSQSENLKSILLTSAKTEKNDEAILVFNKTIAIKYNNYLKFQLNF